MNVDKPTKITLFQLWFCIFWVPMVTERLGASLRKSGSSPISAEMLLVRCLAIFSGEIRQLNLCTVSSCTCAFMYNTKCKLSLYSYLYTQSWSKLYISICTYVYIHIYLSIYTLNHVYIIYIYNHSVFIFTLTVWLYMQALADVCLMSLVSEAGLLADKYFCEQISRFRICNVYYIYICIKMN